jgi:hypothetical protein
VEACASLVAVGTAFGAQVVGGELEVDCGGVQEGPARTVGRLFAATWSSRALRASAGVSIESRMRWMAGRTRCWTGLRRRGAPAVEDAEPAVFDRVDAGYRSKYGRHASIVDSITDEEHRATTLRLVPKPARRSHRCLRGTPMSMIDLAESGACPYARGAGPRPKGRERALDEVEGEAAPAGEVLADEHRVIVAELTVLHAAAMSRSAKGTDEGSDDDRGETVVVILQDSTTKAEHSLVEAGKDAEALQLRRSFQETMRVDLVAAVERLTASRVQVFMSANQIAPDRLPRSSCWTPRSPRPRNRRELPSSAATSVPHVGRLADPFAALYCRFDG